MNVDGSNNNQITNNTSFSNGEHIWRLVTSPWSDENNSGSLNSRYINFHLNRNNLNPSKIYQILKIIFVIIQVYVVLRNEIAILVNEVKLLGDYEINLEIGWELKFLRW